MSFVRTGSSSSHSAVCWSSSCAINRRHHQSTIITGLCLNYQWVNVKVCTLDIALVAGKLTPEALMHGTRYQGISQFYPQYRVFVHEQNERCLCLSSRRRLSFTIMASMLNPCRNSRTSIKKLCSSALAPVPCRHFYCGIPLNSFLSASVCRFLLLSFPTNHLFPTPSVICEFCALICGEISVQVPGVNICYAVQFFN